MIQIVFDIEGESSDIKRFEEEVRKLVAKQERNDHYDRIKALYHSLLDEPIKQHKKEQSSNKRAPCEEVLVKLSQKLLYRTVEGRDSSFGDYVSKVKTLSSSLGESLFIRDQLYEIATTAILAIEKLETKNGR